jgi:hypothetical protein
MVEIQANRETTEHDNSNSSLPNFDVIGLLKEGSKSLGLSGKGNVDATAPDSESRSEPAWYAGYQNQSVDEKNDAMLIGGLLEFPTGVAGILAGLKAGVEVGDLVAGPSGGFYGGFVGMTLGALGGAALAGYAGEKISHWMEENR